MLLDLESEHDWENLPESESDWESDSEPKTDSDSEPADIPIWDLKDYDDLELSDMLKYEDYPLPIVINNKNMNFKNQAMKDLQKAEAEYNELVDQLPYEGPWDAAFPPTKLHLIGGIRPYAITDKNRPRLIQYCNLSLNKYNAENQGANFVFCELVKATSPVSCPVYYITFMAKDDASNNNNADVSTFQAKVTDKLVPNPLEAEVVLCKMKPN